MTSTRERIQRVSLDLFLRQGYEKTSLREIAEELGVTKAALYYHFKTKDDILTSYFVDFGDAVKALLDWAETQEPTPRLRRELLTRYMDIISERHKMIQFVHENQPTMRRLDEKSRFKTFMNRMNNLMTGPDADLESRLRGFQAIMTAHTSWFLFFEEEGIEREELRAAALNVALGMLAANDIHRAADPVATELATAAIAAAEDALEEQVDKNGETAPTAPTAEPSPAGA
ncbi:TetR/AcrR family transcriptional regulator [Actinorhabdospora filicis]|nr:TetR/AcrR family transcriptional regulator [Actinorhabdospora filicis]